MRRALIIDDEKLIREGLKTYIDWEALSLSVCALCANGADGFAAILEHAPDIVIADISMPIMSGLEMLKKIREKRLRCELIFISAYSDFEYAKEALQLGAFDYLLKPLEAPVLFETVKRCVEKIEAAASETLPAEFAAYLRETVKTQAKACDPDTVKKFAPEQQSLPIKCIQYLREKDLDYVFASFFIFCENSLQLKTRLDYALESIHFFVCIFVQLEEYYGKPLYGCTEMRYYMDIIRAAPSVPDLYHTLVRVVSGVFSALRDRQMNSYAQDALRIIRQKYAEEISLGTVAAELLITPSYLSSVFKSGTGYTFSEYVFRFRMYKAQELLKTKKYKIYEIASLAGYPDFVQFSKRFKRFFGYSPKQWGTLFYEHSDDCQ